MKITNLLVRYDKDLRMRMMYPEARREITGEVVRFIRQAPGMNVVAFTFANEGQLHDVIHRELDYFAPMDQPFTWKVYNHDLLPNLKDELLAHDFVEDDEPADVMVLDVNRAPAHLFQPAYLAAGTDIRRITTRDGLKDVIHVLNSVYGNDNSWVNQRLGMHLTVPGYLSVYVAYVHDRPASVAWTYFPHGHFATLFAGSTIAQYRRQGLYTSLLATRVKEIRERGYLLAAVEAGAMSRPIVAKHGFQHLTTVWDYKWRGNWIQSNAADCSLRSEVVLSA
jgi:GNAT superfamily N-acetyltransferase